MEDFSGEIRKNVKAFSMQKPPKSRQTWTLLFIGSHGKTITFKRFKGIFIFFMIVLFSAISVAAGLYLLYDVQVKSGKIMKSEAETLRLQIAQLKSENELLMARAVLAESKLQSSAAAPPKDSKKVSEPEKAAESPQPSESLQPEQTMPESQPPVSENSKEDAQKSDKKKSRRNR